MVEPATPLEELEIRMQAYLQAKDQLQLEMLILQAWPLDQDCRREGLDVQYQRVEALKRVINYFEQKFNPASI